MTSVTTLTCDPKALDALTPHQLFGEICQIRDQYVREVPGRRRSWPKSIRARVLALARLGIPFSKIAEVTGISRASVFLWCGKSGTRAREEVPVPPAGSFVPLNRPVVRLDSDQTPKAAQIHRQTGDGLRLRLPSGHEFIGLGSVSELLALYRALETGSGS